MPQIIEKWPERIGVVLKDKDISVSELARKTGIRRDTIYAYLGRASAPSGSKLFAIANVVDVSLDWLVGRPGAVREYGDKAMLQSVHAGIIEAIGLVSVPVYTTAEVGVGRIKRQIRKARSG